MGVMTEPRSDGDTTQGDRRLDEKLSSGGDMNREEIKGLNVEENGEEIVEEGILDENANVEFTKEALIQDDGDGQEQDQTLPSENDITQENEAMDDVKLSLPAEEDAEDGKNTGEERQEGEGGEDVEGEEVEEEEEIPEMTPEEKEAMREAVKDGNIDLLEDLLDKPGADINMVYFQENLLMTAIRAGHGPMAEFLLDNGVDRSFSTTMVQMKETGGKHPTQRIEWYEVTCRQMAYDKGMLDIVELIDTLDGRLFPGYKPKERIPRLRRPPSSTRSVTSEEEESTSDSDDGDFSATTSADDSDISGEGQSSPDDEIRSRRRWKRKSRASSGKSATTADTSDGEGGLSGSLRNKLMLEEQIDRDSGHHSIDPSVAGTVSEKEKDERRRKKKKKKNKEKEEEKEEPAAEGEQEEPKDSPKADHSAAGSEGQGEAAESASKVGTPRSSQQSADGGTVVNDEGYETMSPSPSLLLKHQQQQQQEVQPLVCFQPPSIPVKTTKSSLALRRTTETHLYLKVPARYNEARPLQWRKVHSVGSYATESPLWHRSQRGKVSGPMEITPSAETTETTTTTVLSGAGLRMDSKSYLQELDSGNTTKPKILNPSSKTHASQSSSFPAARSGEEVASKTNLDPFSPTASSTQLSGGRSGAKWATTTSTQDNATPSTVASKMYPLKQRVPQPNYMKMTKSCFVKRKLEPNFTNVYTSLDFVPPTPSGVRTSSEIVRIVDKGALKKTTVATPRNSRSVVSFPHVSSDIPPGYRLDTVHNIRNNSTVVQTPKIKPGVMTKTR